METVNKHIQEETKKSLDAFDKTLIELLIN